LSIETLYSSSNDGTLIPTVEIAESVLIFSSLSEVMFTD
jgi:hypothetical protein